MVSIELDYKLVVDGINNVLNSFFEFGAILFVMVWFSKCTELSLSSNIYKSLYLYGLWNSDLSTTWLWLG